MNTSSYNSNNKKNSVNEFEYGDIVPTLVKLSIVLYIVDSCNRPYLFLNLLMGN